MGNSTVLCDCFVPVNRSRFRRKKLDFPSNSMLVFRNGRRRPFSTVPSAKSSSSSGNRTWWQKFFVDEDGNWFGLKDDDMLEEPKGSHGVSEGEGEAEEESFEAWKRRAEAISELREMRQEAKNAESRRWEDWLGEETSGGGTSYLDGDDDDERQGEVPVDSSTEFVPKKGVVEAMRNLVLGSDEDDLLYEDRVFRYASFSSAKFLALLVIVPWVLDFVVHDYVLMPFLDRYVKTVPLAAELLDVRRYQKLEMIKTLEIDKARFRFEVEIGKSPPLSDVEVWLELRHKAIELRDEWRLENRKSFANIWSDMVFGIALFFLIYFNQSNVALLKFTGYKMLNNISDTGKAFLIILVTDIFLGYHSESGWQTLIEIILEHYGLEVDQAAITIFICFVPVVIDSCVKLWFFKFLPRLSPKVTNIFREMKRH